MTKMYSFIITLQSIIKEGGNNSGCSGKMEYLGGVFYYGFKSIVYNQIKVIIMQTSVQCCDRSMPIQQQ